jgi:predicted phosphodiesterase
VKDPKTYNIPHSDETDYTPFQLKGHKRVAIFSDIHAPYHSISAITAAIQFIKKEKIDGLLINGDHFDFHGLSKFVHDPRKRDFVGEISTGCELINVFKKEFKCSIYFKLGNHDERYQHFLWMKAGEIQGLEDFQLENIIRKRVGDITVIGDRKIIKANKLNIIHGHEFGGSVFSPVNIARGFYLRAKASTLGGHHHRTSEHTEQDINGEIVTTWSTGCLSELHPSYLPINSWNHGFAIIDLASDGREYEVRNKRIYKGKVL